MEIPYGAAQEQYVRSLQRLNTCRLGHEGQESLTLTNPINRIYGRTFSQLSGWLSHLPSRSEKAIPDSSPCRFENPRQMYRRSLEVQSGRLKRYRAIQSRISTITSPMTGPLQQGLWSISPSTNGLKQ